MIVAEEEELDEELDEVALELLVEDGEGLLVGLSGSLVGFLGFELSGNIFGAGNKLLNTSSASTANDKVKIKKPTESPRLELKSSRQELTRRPAGHGQTATTALQSLRATGLGASRQWRQGAHSFRMVEVSCSQKPHFAAGWRGSWRNTTRRWAFGRVR